MKVKDLVKKHSLKAVAESAGVSEAQVYNWVSQNRDAVELKEGGWMVASKKIKVINL